MATNSIVYHDLTPAQVRHQYDIAQWVTKATEWQQQYVQASEQVLQEHIGHVDLNYGDHSRQSLDLFVPTDHREPVPILIFIHGGYWRANSKDTRRFPAPVVHQEGVAWCPINYRLAPEVKLTDIVADVRSAIAWLYHHAFEYGCDPNKFFISGNSAGGHLVAMTQLTGWHQQYNLPENIIKGGCAISGLFDLEPLLFAEPNDWLRMDIDEAKRFSPLTHEEFINYPMIVTCGERESDEFRRQSKDYANKLSNQGIQVDYFEMLDDDHFSIIGRLADKHSRLFQACMKMIKTD